MDRRVAVALLLHIVCYFLGVSSQIAVPTKPPKCVVTSADIAFIIDASGSVNSAEWQQSLDFASNVVKGYDVGPNKVRVALIVFSNTAKIVFNFKQYTTKAQVLSAIANAPKESQSTYTHLALNMARTQLFTSSSGARPNVPDILIVITDGQSSDVAATKTAAQALHQAKVTTVAVGVGGATTSELNTIASKPNLVYSYTDFSKLVSLQKTFSQETCKVAVKLAPTTTPAPITTEKPCLVEKADIAFLLDASGSVDSTEWTQALTFAINIVQSFKTGPNDVRVALVEFSSAATILFDFNRYSTKADIITAIRNAKRSNGGTRTDLGLNMVGSTLFTLAKGMRPGVPNILFVVTDGRSNSASATVTSAKALHNKGITVFAVGVSGANGVELKSIASAPNLVYSYADFNKLALIQKQFNKAVCKVAVSLAPPAPTKPASGCSVNEADIVFVVDTSTSVGPANFNLTKTFLSTMLDRLDFTKTRVGVIQFNDKPSTVFELNQNNNLAGARAAVNGMAYNKGPATRISGALKYMREHSFTAANGDRASAPNIGILVTDGQAKEPYRTQYEANITKKAGMQLFAVGIGNDIDKNELDSLVSSRYFVHLVQNYNGLQFIRNSLASQICQGFAVPTTTPKAPCLCRDKEKDCARYGSNICFEQRYRIFAEETCPVYCDLCKPGCKPIYPPPKVCVDTITDCDLRIDICTDPKYKSYALQACPKYCKFCAELNPPRIVQTTTPTTISPPTTVKVTRKTVPPSPTKFVPCDPNCYDKKRDCRNYPKNSCSRKDFEAFYRANCEEYCGFCTPKPSCIVKGCRDQQDCSGYPDSSCWNYPQWANTTCPDRCGLCPGGTPVKPGTTPAVCEDIEADCSSFGNDVCTDYPDFSKKNCRLYCGICKPSGPTTKAPCVDKRDCTLYKKEYCTNPDYRKFMLRDCRLFCNLCDAKN